MQTFQRSNYSKDKRTPSTMHSKRTNFHSQIRKKYMEKFMEPIRKRLTFQLINKTNLTSLNQSIQPQQQIEQSDGSYIIQQKANIPQNLPNQPQANAHHFYQNNQIPPQQSNNFQAMVGQQNDNSLMMQGNIEKQPSFFELYNPYLTMNIHTIHQNNFIRPQQIMLNYQPITQNCEIGNLQFLPPLQIKQNRFQRQRLEKDNKQKQMQQQRFKREQKKQNEQRIHNEQRERDEKPVKSQIKFKYNQQQKLKIQQEMIQRMQNLNQRKNKFRDNTPPIRKQELSKQIRYSIQKVVNIKLQPYQRNIDQKILPIKKQKLLLPPKPKKSNDQKCQKLPQKYIEINNLKNVERNNQQYEQRTKNGLNINNKQKNMLKAQNQRNRKSPIIQVNQIKINKPENQLILNYLQNKKQQKKSRNNLVNQFQNQSKIIKTIGNFVVFQRQLGSGTFATVYEGLNTKTNEKVAVKVIKYKRQKDISEHKCLQNIKHEFIISMYDHYVDQKQKKLYLIMQYCSENLRQRIQRLNKENINQDEIIKKKIKFSEMIIQAMNGLFKNNLLHRDLKFQNILVQKDVIKIGDFGLARELNQKLQLESVRCGTPYTMSPQIFFHPKDSLMNPVYTFKSDIFSLCVILHTMFYLDHPFRQQSQRLLKLKRQNVQDEFERLNTLVNGKMSWIEEIIMKGLQYVDSRLDWNYLMQIYQSRGVAKSDQSNSDEEISKIDKKKLKDNFNMEVQEQKQSQSFISRFIKERVGKNKDAQLNQSKDISKQKQKLQLSKQKAQVKKQQALAKNQKEEIKQKEIKKEKVQMMKEQKMNVPKCNQKAGIEIKRVQAPSRLISFNEIDEKFVQRRRVEKQRLLQQCQRVFGKKQQKGNTNVKWMQLKKLRNANHENQKEGNKGHLVKNKQLFAKCCPTVFRQQINFNNGASNLKHSITQADRHKCSKNESKGWIQYFKFTGRHLLCTMIIVILVIIFMGVLMISDDKQVLKNSFNHFEALSDIKNN